MTATGQKVKESLCRRLEELRTQKRDRKLNYRVLHRIWKHAAADPHDRRSLSIQLFALKNDIEQLGKAWHTLNDLLTLIKSREETRLEILGLFVAQTRRDLASVK